ncbi:hypothetical protein AYI95_08070 [Shewanella xiamenensis]|nr:hypothetical protein AYI95_08070 [Shewanella xiamenensis]
MIESPKSKFATLFAFFGDRAIVIANIFVSLESFCVFYLAISDCYVLWWLLLETLNLALTQMNLH